jgi:hypothetical protein
MKKEHQRIAIAKACGLTIVSDGITHHLTPCGKKTALDPEGCSLKECPDYLNDLNAMNEAEKVLLRDSLDAMNYRSALVRIVERDGKLNGARYLAGEWHAAAAQRVEALLKTLGLWVP